MTRVRVPAETVFDGYEDETQPWQICHDACRHGAVDTLSSSLISRQVPWLFTSSWGATGVIIAPDAEILCSFPADSGTGGHPNGRCGDPKVGTEWFCAPPAAPLSPHAHAPGRPTRRAARRVR